MWSMRAMEGGRCQPVKESRGRNRAGASGLSLLAPARHRSHEGRERARGSADNGPLVCAHAPASSIVHHADLLVARLIRLANFEAALRPLRGVHFGCGWSIGALSARRHAAVVAADGGLQSSRNFL